MQNVVDKFHLLDESLLAPWQKIDAAAAFLMPKLDFIMKGAEVEVRPLERGGHDNPAPLQTLAALAQPGER